MRFPVRRLLVVGGGAVILATAGFAYLASNNMPASSSIGEGSVTATGYAVGPISWYTSGCSSYPGGTCNPTNTAPYYVEGLSFSLTSIATTAPGNGVPNQIVVNLTYPNAPSGFSSTVTLVGVNSGYTPAPGVLPSPAGACTLGGVWSNNWTIGGSGTGSGTVTCSVYIAASGEPSFGSSSSATDTIGVDIEANQ
jgi:hypothetical protein